MLAGWIKVDVELSRLRHNLTPQPKIAGRVSVVLGTGGAPCIGELIRYSVPSKYHLVHADLQVIIATKRCQPRLTTVKASS